MAADSMAMKYFRANVLRIIAETEGLTISSLARALTERRKPDEPAVSRPFLSNLLNGHFACSVPFAEDVADVLGVSVSELLGRPPKKTKQPA